ncbi:MAG: metal-dependent transcriptional regulator [Spirochaetota bacterium]
MDRFNTADEYIEAVWILLERGHASLETLADYVGSEYDRNLTQELVDRKLIYIDEESGEISYSGQGEEIGRNIIRAHRLAERLLHDVLKIDSYELAACEFEHIIDTDLIDALCTLLGHPRTCPDGLPIPTGECCRREQKTFRSPSLSLLELKPEESGRVAAVHCNDSHQLQLLELLQIRPGVVVQVHQISPSIVIECDGSNIALDEEIAASVYVWRMNRDQRVKKEAEPSRIEKRGRKGSRKRRFL